MMQNEYFELIRKKIGNYNLIEEQKQRRAIVLEGYPYWMTIDPANSCNLECPLCPTGQRRGSRAVSSIKMDLADRIIDELGEYLIHIDFCNWGEPLLNENIYRMIAKAKKYEIHTKLDTNFNIFDEEKAEALVNSGLDKIILSIDGASQETYSIYRKNGDFNRVIRNVKILVEKRKDLKKTCPRIEWQFLVFKHNEHEIDKAKKIARELCVDEINFTPPYAGSLDWLTTLEPFRSKYYKVEDGRVEFKESARHTLCNWLWDAVTINSDGSLSPCCSVEDSEDDFFKSYPAGASFKTIWNSEKYREARKYVLSDAIPPEKAGNICLRCDHAGLSNHMDIEFMVMEMEEMVEKKGSGEDELS